MSLQQKLITFTKSKIASIPTDIYTIYWIYVLFTFIVLQKQKLFVLETFTDSNSYMDWSLRSYRTFAYPLLLHIISFFSKDFELLPEVQFFISALAIFILLISLKIYQFSGWQSLVIVLPLLSTESIYSYFYKQLAENLAVSFAIATIAFLLMTVSNIEKRFYWLGLGMSLFLTYQTRPSFLFMIPLIPILGIVLFLLKYGKLSWLESIKIITFKFCIVSILPILVFSSFRAITVNDFGIVSFSGHNIAGITTQMLTPQVIEQLPIAQQDLANAILERRNKRMQELFLPDLEYAKTNQGITPSGVNLSGCTTSLLKSHIKDFYPWINCQAYNYSHNATASRNTIFEIYGTYDPVLVSQTLQALSNSILQLKLTVYIHWFIEALIHSLFAVVFLEPLILKLSYIFYGVLFLYFILPCLCSRIKDRILKRGIIVSSYTTLFVPVILSFFVPVILGLDLANIFYYSIFRTMARLLLALLILGSIGHLIIVDLFPKRARYRFSWLYKYFSLFPKNIVFLTLVSFSFFLSGTILVILVEPPLRRYIIAVSFLFPSLLSLISLNLFFNTLDRIKRQ
ncbi:MAG: hypothetical protein AAGA60_31910 [Cyanobacteria bacterium P01_E01_bin.42]